LATIVNYVHDVAKIKPRKFPAVEIRRKFIGIFISFWLVIIFFSE